MGFFHALLHTIMKAVDLHLKVTQVLHRNLTHVQLFRQSNFAGELWSDRRGIINA
jgi:hypothetical protein